MYSSLVIGCGNIGAGYDFNQGQVLTHVKALALNPAFSLTVFDTDRLLLDKVSEKYGVRAMDRIEPSDLSSFDCVSICTPTSTHFEYLTLSIAAGVKVILCEKPVSNDPDELMRLKDSYRSGSSRILVNYVRRFQPAYTLLKEKIAQIRSDEKLTNIAVRYQRGFINNCSHAFDIIEHLLDDDLVLTGLKKHAEMYDHFLSDPTLSLQGMYGDANVNITGLVNVRFSHFEIDLYFHYHKITIKDAGQTIEILRAEASEDFLKPLALQNSYTDCLKNYMIPVISEAQKLLTDPTTPDNFIRSAGLNMRMLNYLNN